MKELNDPISVLERFRLAEDEQADFDSRFQRVEEVADLVSPVDLAPIRAKYTRVPGIYLWMACLGQSRYKVYAGKTNSLAYRIENYTAAFQPHAPNDFKLMVFRAFLSESIPEAVLRLHFRSVELNSLGLEEKETIRRYKPLLNVRRTSNPEARQRLQAAFAQYYRSTFEAGFED